MMKIYGGVMTIVLYFILRRNLKRQNLDLLEQLHHSTTQLQALEASNQSLQQSQHHLEVRPELTETLR